MTIFPDSRGQAVVIDYREKAPAAATPEMLAKRDRFFAYKTVGVPGTLVAGLTMAHQKYGKPSLAARAPDLAIKLRKAASTVDAALARSLNGVLRTAARRVPELR